MRIGLDDFGAGYSNFRYAIDLKLDVIKIDGAIVRTICHNKSSRAVVAAIARLAEDLGCDCVAEWVEDQATLNALQALHVHYVQGHLVAPALEPSAFFNAPRWVVAGLPAQSTVNFNGTNFQIAS